MPDSPDPLGKRALFWAPAERVEDGPRRPSAAHVRGKHALYSAADAAVGAERISQTASGSRAERDGPVGGAVPPATASASGVRRTREDVVDWRDALGVAAAPARRALRLVGAVTLECSSCRAVTDVDVFEYLMLHLPVWLWRPGKGYTRLMTCPVCRRRTWISASLRAWGR